MELNGLEGVLNAEDGEKRFMFLNEGFKRQKHTCYHIVHASSHDYTAIKNHYLLTQITDILMQLFENSSNVVKRVRRTIKETSSNLLKAIQNSELTDEDIQQIFSPIQARFT